MISSIRVSASDFSILAIDRSGHRFSRKCPQDDQILRPPHKRQRQKISSFSTPIRRTPSPDPWIDGIDTVSALRTMIDPVRA